MEASGFNLDMTGLIYLLILLGVGATAVAIAKRIRKSADNESLFDDDE